VELLKPLAILHVALASRHVAHMTCIDQVDFDAGSFKLLDVSGHSKPATKGRN
jgi:hypothetical protein